MKLVSVSEMKAIESQANERGVTYEMMMANAGKGLAQEIRNAYSHLDVQGITGLIGSGNNGGDTLVALTHLAGDGIPVRAYILRERLEGDPLVTAFEKAGGEIGKVSDDPSLKKLRSFLEKSSILLDGLLGTGVKLPLKADFAGILDKIQPIIAQIRDRLQVVAVDCPSGVDCDSGEAPPQTIPADITVTMAAVKAGLLALPAFELAGEIRLVDIGLPPDLPAWEAVRTNVVDAHMVANALPKRPLSAHKGTFGTALAIAGSVNYTGAGLMAGRAAYRVGAGLVTLAIPEPLHVALAGHFPEATWLILPDEDGVISPDGVEVVHSHLERITALLLGPGWGMETPTLNFLKRFLDVDQAASHEMVGFVPFEDEEKPKIQLPPIIVDADGLKLLAKVPDWPKWLPARAVLTPHPGEMSILCGLSVKEIQADRIAIARKFASKWGHVLVLKGAFTVIADPSGEIAVIPVATPALARAGTGDVLAGTILGLRAQGMDAFPAAWAGAWLHAQAGLLAAEEMGNTASVLAGDVLDRLSEVITHLPKAESR
jgi:hydroxyethylthiazole kinase-like uncharacterized protein yjeF